MWRKRKIVYKNTKGKSFSYYSVMPFFPSYLMMNFIILINNTKVDIVLDESQKSRHMFHLQKTKNGRHSFSLYKSQKGSEMFGL